MQRFYARDFYREKSHEWKANFSKKEYIKKSLSIFQKGKKYQKNNINSHRKKTRIFNSFSLIY